MSFIRLIFTGEFIFFAFIYAGLYKGSLNFFPIDLTLLLGGLSLLIAIKRLYFKSELKKKAVVPIILYSLLAMAILISLWYTPSEIYAKEKTIKVMTVTAWAFIGVPFLVSSKESLIKFLKSGILLMTVTAVPSLIEFLTTNNSNILNSRVRFDDGPVISLARGLGIAVLSTIFLYQFGKIERKRKVVALLVTTLLLVTLFLTGSRMPILSLLLVLTLIAVTSVNFTKGDLHINKGLFSLVGLFFIVGLVIILFSDKFSTLAFRLEILFLNYDSGASAAERTMRFNESFDIFKEAPFMGIGVGGFAVEYLGVDQRSYPHNLFLEILSEQGFMGFIPLIMLIFIPLFSLALYMKKKKLNNIQKAVLFIFIFLFLNINVSGDINDNRVFFLFLSLLYFIPLYENENRLVEEKNPMELKK